MSTYYIPNLFVSLRIELGTSIQGDSILKLKTLLISKNVLCIMYANVFIPFINIALSRPQTHIWTCIIKLK